MGRPNGKWISNQTSMRLQCERGAGRWGWDNMVSRESASSSQGCTMNTAMLLGIAGTALYTWVVREGASGWWGISPPGRVLRCCLWGAECWRCQDTQLSLNANHRIGSSCKYMFLREGERVSSHKHGDPRNTVSPHSWQTLPTPVFRGKPLQDSWGPVHSQWRAVW